MDQGASQCQNLASALPVKPRTLGHTHLHRGSPLTKLSARRDHLFLNCTKAFQGPVVGTALDHSWNCVSFILLKVLLKTEIILYSYLFPYSDLILSLCKYTWDRTLTVWKNRTVL